MKRKKFIKTLFGAASLAIFPWNAFAGKFLNEIHFFRHATFLLKTASGDFLIDPMLSDKDEMDPVLNAKVTKRIPMTELPFKRDRLLQLLSGIRGIILTHLHRDHWDQKARELITDKNIPIICQPADLDTLSGHGFTNLHPIETEIRFEGLKIWRTPARHGTGDLGKKMAPASGFVIQSSDHVIYIAGDSIWCDEVKDTIRKHKPDTIVVNAGAAQFNEGDPITMTAPDVVNVCQNSGKSRIVAVHMDTINHCLLTRKELSDVLRTKNLTDRCVIPADGDVILLK